MSRLLSIALSLVLVTPPLVAHPFHSGVKPKEIASGRLTDPEQIRETLRQFHGHLGPYATLGYRMGARAVERLQCAMYFGLRVTVEGRSERPYGCFADGLQVGTGCTAGKANLTIIGTTPGEGQPPFVVTVRTSDGKGLRLKALPSVPELFGEWLESGDTEDETFDRLMVMPREELWTEEELALQPLEQYLRVVREPLSRPPDLSGPDGEVRVHLCGKGFSAVSFEVPPGHLSPPQAGGLAGLEGTTVVVRGKLDLVDGSTRLTVSQGELFVWPPDTSRAVGYQNPYPEPCVLLTIYTPSFPGVSTPDEAVRWVQMGAPASGLPAE